MAENVSEWPGWKKPTYRHRVTTSTKTHLELDLVDKFLLSLNVYRLRHQQTNILQPQIRRFWFSDFSDAMGWKSLGSLIHVDVRGVSSFSIPRHDFPGSEWNLTAVVCKMNHHQWCSELFAVSFRGRVLKKKSHKHIGIENQKNNMYICFAPKGDDCLDFATCNR